VFINLYRNASKHSLKMHFNARSNPIIIIGPVIVIFYCKLALAPFM
jgi:hypothetical protein